MTLNSSRFAASASVEQLWVSGGDSIAGSLADLDPTPVDPDPSPPATVTITGNPTQGSTLVVSNTIGDADGLGAVTYRWFADGEEVALGSELTLEQQHVGRQISVTATYLNRAGEFTTLDSAATRAVANVNDAPVLSDPSPLALTMDEAGDPVVLVGGIVVDDLDGDALQFSLDRGQADSVTGLISSVGVYGTLVLDPASGEFSYTPDGDALLSASRDPVDFFLVSVTDGEFTETAVLEVGQFDAYSIEVLDPNADGALWDARFTTTNGNNLAAEDLQLFRTYGGVLGRTPDAGGFQFYQQAIADGDEDLFSMTEDFLWSDEFLSFFPDATRPTDISSADFVNFIYTNVFGRAPDADGFSFWTGELDSGSRDQANVAVSMTQSNEFIALTAIEAADYLIG